MRLFGRWPRIVSGIWLLFMLFSGCESAFAPPDSGSSGNHGHNPDSSDGDIMETDGGEIEYNLILRPDYARQGDTFLDGAISFRNEEEVRAKLAEGDPAFQSYAIDYGEYVNFLLVRFDPDLLRFYDIQAVVSAIAPTDSPQKVYARITYGDVNVVEYGKFHILPSIDGPAVVDTAGKK